MHPPGGKGKNGQVGGCATRLRGRPLRAGWEGVHMCGVNNGLLERIPPPPSQQPCGRLLLLLLGERAAGVVVVVDAAKHEHHAEPGAAA